MFTPFTLAVWCLKFAGGDAGALAPVVVVSFDVSDAVAATLLSLPLQLTKTSIKAKKKKDNNLSFEIVVFMIDDCVWFN